MPAFYKGQYCLFEKGSFVNLKKYLKFILHFKNLYVNLTDISVIVFFTVQKIKRVDCIYG